MKAARLCKAYPDVPQNSPPDLLSYRYRVRNSGENLASPFGENDARLCEGNTTRRPFDEANADLALKGLDLLR